MPENLKIRMNVVAAGFPDAGKSTLLGGLYFSLSQRRVDGIELTRMPTDTVYANKIANNYSGYSVQDRTVGIDFLETLDFGVKIKGTTSEIDVFLSDMSGETFSALWERREFGRRPARAVDEANRIILFLNHENAGENPEIADAPYGNMGGSAVERPWKAEDTELQVKLVQVLQDFDKRLEKSAELVVVVSAWDTLAETNGGPKNWVKKRLPLLAQFIEMNFENENKESACCYWFGVSAQGGRLEKDDHPNQKAIATDLAKKVAGKVRIFAVDKDNKKVGDFEFFKIIFGLNKNGI